MRAFEHVEAHSTRAALDQLEDDGMVRPIAGGTDLLTVIKKGIVRPRRLVNLKEISDLHYIRHDPGQGLRIGALTTLSEIERHPVVRERFPALAQAIRVAASPQLRNMGTIGGNICQHSRCWYFREDFKCWLKGGNTCFARDGVNTFHSIFGTSAPNSPCISTQPSDLAPVLVAMDGSVHVAGRTPTGTSERILAAEEFFIIPTEGARQLNVLRPEELVLEVQLPEPAVGQRSLYLKAMDRDVWAFALASIALVLRFDVPPDHEPGGKVLDARIVLGGVAAKPWRAHGAEAELIGYPLDTSRIAACAQAAVHGAQPLAHNEYKVALTEGIVKRALEQMLL